jgi:hypothetical protein
MSSNQTEKFNRYPHIYVPEQCTDQMAEAIFKITRQELSRSQEMMPVFLNIGEYHPSERFINLAIETFDASEFISSIVVIGNTQRNALVEVLSENLVVGVDPAATVEEAKEFVTEILVREIEDEIPIRITKRLRDEVKNAGKTVNIKYLITAVAMTIVIGGFIALFLISENVRFYSDGNEQGVEINGIEHRF